VVGAAQSGNRSVDAEPYADSDDPLTLNELCACAGGTSIEAANTTAITQARDVERGDRDMEGIARVRRRLFDTLSIGERRPYCANSSTNTPRVSTNAAQRFAETVCQGIGYLGFRGDRVRVFRT
jgi:hypothetical protein